MRCSDEENQDHLKIIGYFSKLLKQNNLRNIDEKLFEMLVPKYKKVIVNEACED